MKVIKMQRNQSIIILEISFPLYSGLGTNYISLKGRKCHDAKLVVNVDILQIKIYQKVLDIYMDLLSKIRNPILFSPHKQPWLRDVLLEEAFRIVDFISSLLRALTCQGGHGQAVRWEQKITKCGKSWK